VKKTKKKADIDPVWTEAAERIVCFGKGYHPEMPFDVQGRAVISFGGLCFRGDSSTYDSVQGKKQRADAVRKLAQTLRRLLGKKLAPKEAK
jgi:hypothetical protein